MTTATEQFVAEEFADQVDAEAKAWIIAKYGRDSGGFAESSMVSAYRIGFAAGLSHARKVFMTEPA